jgi:tetratricopeptide (TPR) repeat protein
VSILVLVTAVVGFYAVGRFVFWQVAGPTMAAGEACERGVALLNQGDSAGAIEACSEAIALDPRLVDAWLTRGAARAYLGQHDKALADFNEAIRLRPDCAPGYWMRGAAYRAMGDAAKGEADQAKARELGFFGNTPID